KAHYKRSLNREMFGSWYYPNQAKIPRINYRDLRPNSHSSEQHEYRSTCSYLRSIVLIRIALVTFHAFNHRYGVFSLSLLSTSMSLDSMIHFFRAGAKPLQSDSERKELPEGRSSLLAFCRWLAIM